jgi:mannosyl-oligosaccharide alpha-1,2-mannosidase
MAPLRRLRVAFTHPAAVHMAGLFDNPLRLAWKRRVRGNLALVAACVFLVLLFTTYLRPNFYAPGGFSSSWSSPSGRCRSFSSSRPYKPPANVTQSKWRQLAVKNPPGELRQLPRETPKQLGQIQFPFRRSKAINRVQRERQEAVKATFQRAWTSYKQKAWLKDELRPMSGGYSNQFGGWGATLVDTLDTLWILDMKEEFYKAVDAALGIDFADPSKMEDDTISVFETTIRFLGGFLSAYEVSGCQDTRVLDKAIEVGDMLYAAFDTPHRIPIPRWSPRKALENAEQAVPDTGTFAGFASLSMEFTRLSQLTGDLRYFDAVQRLTDILDKQQFTTKLPGMWPIRYDWQTGTFNGNSFGLGASADSGYEYLLKMHPLLGGAGAAAAQYERLYGAAVDTAIRAVFFRPMSPDGGGADVLISGRLVVGAEHVPSLITESEHLTCFLGGMVALGGRLFGNASHVDVAGRLARGCVWAYRSTPSGIMPENGKLVPCPTDECAWDEELWQRQGGRAVFPKPYTAVRDPKYILRPEALESLFYMYRITGDPQYRDMAWDMFQTIDRWTKTEYGNAQLTDVMRNPPRKMDAMQSFWTAEAIKYLYLIFSEPDLISLDDWVFNTEAHPLRIPK